MKAKNPRNGDESLDMLLKDWAVTAGVPPRFEEQVWRRIVRRRDEQPAPFLLWALVVGWISHQLPRPALAAAYVLVLFALGGTLGWTQGRQEADRLSDSLGMRYAEQVDPYQPHR